MASTSMEPSQQLTGTPNSSNAHRARDTTHRANGSARLLSRTQQLDPPLRVTTALIDGSGAASAASTVARAGTSQSTAATTAQSSGASTATAPSDMMRPSKRKLVACRIGTHTIEKCTSPKKKALDPMRYMPDRTAAFYVLFTVHVELDGASSARQVYRTYKQFNALHTSLQKKYPKSSIPKDLPSMRKKRYDNDYIEQKKQALNDYLNQLLALPELRQSTTLRAFFEDARLSDDSGNDDDSVQTHLSTRRLLEGRPGTLVTVRAGQSFAVSLDVAAAGDVVSWQFYTKKHNIGFSATFDSATTICVYSREDSQLKPIKGYYTCPSAGVVTLNWDNTYTWSKAKALVYWTDVETTQRRRRSADSQPSTAVDATSASTNTVATSLVAASTNYAASAGHESDARRSGYIESSNRNHALNPRRIVHSSLSLISKPFVAAAGKTKKATSKQQLTPLQSPQLIQAGALIVERNVQFRGGRQWYRKWFVLDARKCVLRYYDSETAARRGLSLAKLSLSHKTASLAVTRAPHAAAPTPYLFVVRARKRSWKICASTLAEFNAWEQAISTAIFSAQLRSKHEHSRDADALDNTVDGASATAAHAKASGNSLLQDNDGDHLDESDGESDDDDDDVDDDEADVDGDARHWLQTKIYHARAFGLPGKLVVLVGVNVLVLSVRTLPLVVIGALLLVWTAVCVAVAVRRHCTHASAKVL